DDPTQHNPYTYGNNNPATYSDPTGEAIAECMRGEIACSGGLPKRKPKINSAVSGGNPGSPGNSGSYIPWTPGSKKRILANPSKGRYNSYGHLGHNSYGHTTSAAQKEYNDAYREERRLADIAYTKAQAEKNKKDEGFEFSLSGITEAAKSGWDKTGGRAVAAVSDHFSEHWRDYLANGVLLVGAAGGLACLASVVCGVGGAIAIGAGTAAANYVASSAGTENWNTATFTINTVTGAGVGYLGGTSAAGQAANRIVSFARMDRSLNRIERTVQRMRDEG
ncbi:hypothetical protein ACIF9R_38210, partial [Streptomyces sp. NPDC086080]